MEVNKGGRTLHVMHIAKVDKDGKEGKEEKTKYLLPDGYKRDPEDTKDVRLIGKGGYGIVLHTVGTTSQIDSKMERVLITVAVKKLLNPVSNARMAQKVYRELKLLQNLSHPNIVRIVDVYTSASNARDLEDVYIVTKFAGSTVDIILSEQIDEARSRNPKPFILSLPIIAMVIRDTLNALKYLKAVNVLHRDLKSGNIAVSSFGRATLIDYGLARIEGNKADALTNPVFTCNYRAIEVILGKDLEIRYGHQADIWSLGCILAEMITWYPLFMPSCKADKYGEIPAKELMELQIARCGPIPDEYLNTIDESHNPIEVRDAKKFIKKLSSKVKNVDIKDYFTKMNKVAKLDDPAEAMVLDFICECLIFDPSKRITIEDAFNHPFIRYIGAVGDYTNVVPLSDEVDCQKDIEEWKQIIYNEILNFRAREDTPMP